MRHRVWSKVLTGIVAGVLAWGSWACDRESVGSEADGGSAADAGPGGDAAVVGDAEVEHDAGAPACGLERRNMGFVFQAPGEPSHPLPEDDQWEVTGTLIHLGPITEPLATFPGFNREAQLEQFDGQVATVQYYVPPGVWLPVALGGQYTFVFRQRWVTGGYTVGFVVQRLTMGIPVLLFVGDAGNFGRAFDTAEIQMQPLEVLVQPLPDCVLGADPHCGGVLFGEQLIFQTDGGSGAVVGPFGQGERGEMELAGDLFVVQNLASNRAEPTCADHPGFDVSYVAINTAELARTCDPSRFYFWDEQYGIEVGTFCDDLYTCVDDPARATAIEQTSPGVTCGVSEPACPAGTLACAWNPGGPVDQALYDQLCAVSLLPAPPDTIHCHTYF